MCLLKIKNTIEAASRMIFLFSEYFPPWGGLVMIKMSLNKNKCLSSFATRTGPSLRKSLFRWEMERSSPASTIFSTVDRSSSSLFISCFFWSTLVTRSLMLCKASPSGVKSGWLWGVDLRRSAKSRTSEWGLQWLLIQNIYSNILEVFEREGWANFQSRAH